MKVNGKHYRTVWMDGSSVMLIEQNFLPFEFKILEAKTYLDTCHAIKTMVTRGAGAIGSTAAYGMAQAFLSAPKKGFWKYVDKAKIDIESTRPTAQNLFYAVNSVYNCAKNSDKTLEAAVKEAERIADENVKDSKDLGKYGNEVIKDGDNIETHCNAGWLASVDYGSALAPIYVAHQKGKKVFVYANETRPRGQGARLTAWELQNEGISHAILPDNAVAYMMSKGKIDLVIVGADRVAANGDVANKIGTFKTAIVAKEFGVPFYVAATTSTFDLGCASGDDIPIEQRSEDEVLYQSGPTEEGEIKKILVSSPGSKAINPAFDVTPARYIRGIITDKGIIKPSRKTVKKLFS